MSLSGRHIIISWNGFLWASQLWKSSLRDTQHSPGAARLEGQLYAPSAQLRPFQVDLLHIGGGAHDALELVAMEQTKRMSEFMDDLLFQAGKEEILGLREAIELVAEPGRGNNRSLAPELCFAEDKRENRDIQIDVDHGDRLLFRERILVQQF